MVSLSLWSVATTTTYRHHSRNTWCGAVSVCNGTGGITFSCSERKESHELFAIQAAIGAICLFRNKRISRNSLPPLSLHSLFPVPMWCVFRSLRAIFVPVFIYLSIRLRVSLFSSACLTFAAAVSLCQDDSPLARPPTFLFYKIDRTDETEETRSMGRNMRI